MVESVNFTRESGSRISDAVKKIERLPSPTNTQRHRAGGLGRMTLWEVTAVQTTPKTVTLKRIQDTADNLNDSSETVDVAYDPDDVPIIGDKGLIVRLGDGTRFFFKKGLKRIYFNEMCYVDSSAAGSNFGYPNVGAAREVVGGLSRIPVAKFASRLSSALPPNEDDIALLMPTIQQGDDGIWSNDESGDRYVNIRVISIKDDFDPSTLTYTQYLALDKENIVDYAALDYRADNFSHRALGRNLSPNTTPGVLIRRNEASVIRKLFINESYGVGFQLIHNLTTAGRVSAMELELESLGSGIAKSGWIEWWT